MSCKSNNLVTMKNKIIYLFLLVSSLIVYLEWGQHNHSFLFQAEISLFLNILKNPIATLHPLTIIPLIGQVLLLIIFFQKKTNPAMLYTSLGCLGILIGFILLVGIFSLNFKIIGSTIPFIICSIWSIKQKNTPTC